MMPAVELMRLFIPRALLINDNHGQSWKTHMGKTERISRMAQHQIAGDLEVCGFTTPPVDEVKEITKDGFMLILEHWKCQQTFDLCNYNMTYKYMIDTLRAAGYFEDDCWKWAWPAVLSGGDWSVWKERAIRFPEDGLPESIKKAWWEENGHVAVGTSLMRVIVADRSWRG